MERRRSSVSQPRRAENGSIAGKLSSPKSGICHHFSRTGRCKFGDSCKYRHEASSDTPNGTTSDNASPPKSNGVCRWFSTPSGCRFGAACRYRHEAETPSDPSGVAENKPPKPLHPVDHVKDKRREWSIALMKADSTSPPKALFIANTGVELIDAGDHTLQQGVIKNLGDEKGLMWIRELLGKQYTLDSPSQPNMSSMVGLGQRIAGFGFHTHCVPFLKLLTNEEMMSSIALENTVGTVYNVVYGPSGTRGITFFEQMVNHLTVLHGTMMEDTESTFEEPAYLVSAALFYTVNLNQGALAQKPLKDLVERLALILREYGGQERYFIRKAAKHIDGLIQRFNIRTVAVEYRKKPVPAAPKFQIQVDPPGELSRLGPRHDNDFVDISKILILPTSQEISSPRQPFLPYHITETYDHEGITSLLDSNFRLLREDTSGQIRDSLAAVIHRWDAIVANEDAASRKRAIRAIEQPIIVFRNIQLERVRFNRNCLNFDISFDQPNPGLPQMTHKARAKWWEDARMLAWGSLLALVEHGQAIFFSVSDRVVVKERKETVDDDDFEEEVETGICDLASNPNRAAIRLQLTEPAAPEIPARLMELSKPGGHPEAILIEFPKLLFASFEPVLACLQDLRANPRVPFSHWLAPPPGSEFEEVDGIVVIPPPLYMTRHRDTVLDLTCITKDRHRLVHSTASPVSIEALKEHTTLDNGQCNSLRLALETELAMIQGPPGTGKSFVGVQLAKVLLANAQQLTLGPILCVTYTNHALDQFLEHILDAGEEGIVRIGARSKNERLRDKMLATLRRGFRRTGIEWEAIRDLETRLKDIRDLLLKCLQNMREVESAHSIAKHLNEHHPNIYDSLFDIASSEDKLDDEGFQQVYHKKYRVEDLYRLWARHYSHPRRKQRISALSNRSSAELQNIRDIWETSPAERLRLKVSWEESLRQQLQEEFGYLLRQQADAYKRLRRQISETDRQCLSSCRIIGVTSTGLAANAALLRSLSCKVLMIEEAGEVLEAHTIISLMPTIEHCILIGDHLQLRPQISRYDLSMESTQGKKYALDMSLFERLATLGIGGYKVPIAQLDVQRRMHPQISNLIRSTLYPQLTDYVDMRHYPEVSGMRKRLFWLDHIRHEDSGGHTEGQKDTSKSNEWEANLCVALVQHLSRQGVYKRDDIAVLTPYLGQLRKLRNKFKGLCDISSIALDDRDLAELADDDSSHAGDGTEKKPTIHVKNIISGLRLATVDNFQGEEAKVVIVSLVRSNAEGKVGFLRTSNRINVLLSRAQHGMYLIGNSSTSAGVPMWNHVLTMLRYDNQVGSSFELQCPRHPDTEILVSSPDEFNELAPEGGCSMRCDRRLGCGHACQVKCHSDYLHNSIRCFQDCLREFQHCDHPCPKRCWEPCGKCVVPITSNITLPCGHAPGSLPCYQTVDLSKVQCHQKVTRVLQKCTHRVTVPCYTNMDNYRCVHICGSVLPCGHSCQRMCYECRDATTDKVDHGDCKSLCGRSFTTCNHACRSACHGGTPCGTCKEQCEIRCAHSRCNKGCAEACSPCTEKCTGGCVHQGKCNMPCAVPCDVLPCGLRCERQLECGHRCPSICGELCPTPSSGCQVCAPPEVLGKQVDLITMETLGEVDVDEDPLIFLPCKHIYTVSTLDGHMDMKEVYDVDINGKIIGPRAFSKVSVKNCPECRYPLRELHRYNRIVKAALLDQTTKRFMAHAATRLQIYLESVGDWESILENMAERFVAQRKTDASADSGFFERYHRTFTPMFASLDQFKNQVSEAEQPYGRVATMVRAIRRQYGTSSAYKVDSSEIQHGFSLKAEALLLRLVWAAMYHLSRALETLQPSGAEKDLFEQLWKGMMHPTLQNARERGTVLIANAIAGKFLYQELEGRIYRAMYTGLMLRHPPEGLDADAIAEEKRVELASLDVCNAKMTASTTSLEEDISQARLLLRDSTFYQMVSTEEKAAVYAAMAQEFRGTGHWYYCENNHPFTIGECGMAMELASCPECGAPVGGGDHVSVAGNRRAEDLEGQFARMRVRDR